MQYIVLIDKRISVFVLECAEIVGVRGMVAHVLYWTILSAYVTASST